MKRKIFSKFNILLLHNLDLTVLAGALKNFIYKFCFIFFFVLVIAFFEREVFSQSQTNSVILTMRIRNTTNYIWSKWDNCDTHFWWKEDWGGTVTLEWGNFHGRNCLKVSITNGTWGLFRTDHMFPAENWGGPGKTKGFKMDVFLEKNESGIGVKIEAQRPNGTTIEPIYSSSNLVYNQWKEIGWNFTTASNYSQVSKLLFVFDGFDTTGRYTFYVDNMRLITNNVSKTWDIMDFHTNSSSPLNWAYAANSDVVNWNTWGGSGAGGLWALEPITHNRTASNSSGSLYMKWDASITNADYAKVEAGNLNEDWSSYSAIRADIYCSGTNEIKVGFWDGANVLETISKKVANINTWETIEWDLPKGTFNWSTVRAVYFLVKTDKVTTGEIYIDNIKRAQ